MSAYEAPGESDEWYTPAYIFEALGERFDLDVASPPGGPRYVPTINWRFSNSLNSQWYGFIWMNPPFGHQSTKRKWLAKFFEHGNGIALLPDRTSAPWWQEFSPNQNDFPRGVSNYDLCTQQILNTPKSKCEFQTNHAYTLRAKNWAFDLTESQNTVSSVPSL